MTTNKTGAMRARLGRASAGGRLYLVGSPIGNLDDITLRAIKTLQEVDLVACEDTRRTQKLLHHFRIKTPTISYHEHNELTRAPELILEMEGGAGIALVSDAGMPVISDPGYRLVKLAIRHGLPVVPIPGASAFVAALSASGLPVDRFRFLGFLPSKKAERRKALEELTPTQKTQVFYEAPHRLLETLGDIHKLLGDRHVVVAREVTKIHEEFVRGSAAEVLERFRKKPVKGEITVLLGPSDDANHGVPAARERPIRREIEQVMAERKLDSRAALKIVARARGISRSEAYRQWQSEKGSGQ